MHIVTSPEARTNLDRLMREAGETPTMLSRVLRRGENYISRHIREGVPALLSDYDARMLADFLGCDARLLGVVMPAPAKKTVAPPWWQKPLP